MRQEFSFPAPAGVADVAPALLFDGNSNGDSERGIDFSYGLVNAETLGTLARPGGPDPAVEGLRLIPTAHRWVNPETGQRQAPLPLCEFLAYKAAFAYQDRRAISAAFSPEERVAFFESRKDGGVDTQGYGFFHQGHAFIILRGTESRGDWQINLADRFTHTLVAGATEIAAADDPTLKKLHALYAGDLLSLIGKLTPGRHLGFTIGWAVVREQIEKWLATLPDGVPVVFSGHSLGGALALLGAYDFASRPNPHDIAAVVTFGAPLVGDADFAAEYDALPLREPGARLGDRTVRIESEGDIVPKIMRRWYYRLPAQTKGWIQRRLQSELRGKPNSDYRIVGREWVFDKQPPLSDGEFRSAVWSIRNAAERKAREEAGQVERTKIDAPSEPQAAEPAQAAETAQPAPSSPPPKDNGKGSVVIVYVVVSAVVLVSALLVWLFIRSKLASHAISHRYALYLSTLSYQRIRELHGGDLERANADLERYLAFIRGDHGARDDAFLKDLRALPLRLNADYDVQTFLSNGTNIC